MPVKVWNVGDVLAAADVNAWLAPLAGVKSANQTISSSTTFINDADMRFAVAANSIYEFHVFVNYSSATGADFKSSFTVPTGASAKFQRVGRQQSDGAFVGDAIWLDTDTVTAQGRGVGTQTAHSFFGVLATGSTAGNLIYQWAQFVSTASNTVLYQNSYLTGRRIG